MNADFRVSTACMGHPKIVKLRRRLGADAVLSLFALWAWTAQERPSGCLHGMDSEDIAIAADWNGDEQAFTSTLIALRLLDADEGGTMSVHDWAEHNPWAAGAETRSEKARAAALKRWESVTPMLNHASSIDEHGASNAPSIAEQCPSPQHSVVCGVTTTPNPSSKPSPAETHGDAVVCGGDGETESRDVVVLEYPPSLSAYERQQAETLVQGVTECAQELLDELTAAIQAKKVKTSPVAYLRGLTKRAAAGTFAAEAGQRIAQERERRRRAMAAVAAAATRPPDTPARRDRTGPIDVRAHLAALRAAMGGERQDIAA